MVEAVSKDRLYRRNRYGSVFESFEPMTEGVAEYFSRRGIRKGVLDDYIAQGAWFSWDTLEILLDDNGEIIMMNISSLFGQ